MRNVHLETLSERARRQLVSTSLLALLVLLLRQVAVQLELASPSVVSRILITIDLQPVNVAAPSSRLAHVDVVITGRLKRPKQSKRSCYRPTNHTLFLSSDKELHRL